MNESNESHKFSKKEKKNILIGFLSLLIVGLIVAWATGLFTKGINITIQTQEGAKLPVIIDSNKISTKDSIEKPISNPKAIKHKGNLILSIFNEKDEPQKIDKMYFSSVSDKEFLEKGKLQ